MRTLSLALLGTSPLLLHKIANHQRREEISSHASNGVSLEKEALEKMMKDESGNPAVPSEWLWNSIRVACSKIVIDGKQVSFTKLQSAIYLRAGFLQLKSRSGGLNWTVYTSRQHAMQKSNRMILVVAPMFRDWKLEFQVSAEDSIPDSLLQKIFYEAGKSGIGLFHPPKKHFGQFRCLVR